MKTLIETFDSLPQSLAAMVEQGHIQDEASQGIVCNYKPLTIAMKEADTGKFIAALTAYTAFAEVYVDDIWVHPDNRKLGLGRKLLQALEDTFAGKGYDNINLVTSQFQAPNFYKSCGFELEFVRKNKVNPKLTKYFFIKYFNESKQTQGVLPAQT